jgi:hypothetical protein
MNELILIKIFILTNNEMIDRNINTKTKNMIASYYLRHLKHHTILSSNKSLKFGDYITWELYYNLKHIGQPSEIHIKNNSIKYKSKIKWSQNDNNIYETIIDFDTLIWHGDTAVDINPLDLCEYYIIPYI